MTVGSNSRWQRDRGTDTRHICLPISDPRPGQLATTLNLVTLCPNPSRTERLRYTEGGKGIYPVPTAKHSFVRSGSIPAFFVSIFGACLGALCLHGSSVNSANYSTGFTCGHTVRARSGGSHVSHAPKPAHLTDRHPQFTRRYGSRGLRTHESCLRSRARRGQSDS